MASGVTYQSLDRLTYLSDRDALKNGNVIAGQPYYDVYFTGGYIANVELVDVTINGFSSFLSYRVITASGNVNATDTDNTIVIDKTVGENTTVYLPADLTADSNQLIVIKDGKGDADTHNITVNGNGYNIDANSTYVIGSPYAWITLQWIGTGWSQIG